MFYFISGVHHIAEIIKINDDISIRNPNTEEILFFEKMVSEQMKDWGGDKDKKTEKLVLATLKDLIIVDFSSSIMNIKSFNKENFLLQKQEYEKNSHIINLVSFIATRLKLGAENTQLGYGVKFTNRLNQQGKDFIDKLIIQSILDPELVEIFYNFDIKIFKELFDLMSVYPKNKDRLIFIGETITSIQNINDDKLKLILLTGIVENFLVNKIDNIEYQIKLKLIPILNGIEHYNIHYSIGCNEDILKEFHNLYYIRSKIAHGDFKGLEKDIKNKFGKDQNLGSIKVGLEQKVAKIIYMYLCDPKLFNLLKNT